MNQPRIIGIDPSLTGTGIATATTEACLKNDLRGPRRLCWIRDRVNEIMVDEGIGLVVIEGYSHASINQAHQLGELGGVLRALFWEQNVPFVEIAPGTLKKFATGSGKGEKTQMLSEAIRRLGYEGSNLDVADALWLYEAGRAIYHGNSRVPQSRYQELFDKVEWPGLEGSGSKVVKKGRKKPATKGKKVGA